MVCIWYVAVVKKSYIATKILVLSDLASGKSLCCHEIIYYKLFIYCTSTMQKLLSMYIVTAFSIFKGIFLGKLALIFSCIDILLHNFIISFIIITMYPQIYH